MNQALSSHFQIRKNDKTQPTHYSKKGLAGRVHGRLIKCIFIKPVYIIKFMLGLYTLHALYFLIYQLVEAANAPSNYLAAISVPATVH